MIAAVGFDGVVSRTSFLYRGDYLIRGFGHLIKPVAIDLCGISCQNNEKYSQDTYLHLNRWLSMSF